MAENAPYKPHSDEFRDVVRELCAIARDDERKWRTIVTYFRDGLLANQPLLVEVVWGHAKYLSESDDVAAFVRLLDELGLRLTVTPTPPTTL